MLSSYRPGTPTTPFTAYCTQGLAYMLRRGHPDVAALVAARAGFEGGAISAVQVQVPIAGGGFADLLVTYESGQRVLAEVQIELGGSASESIAATARSSGNENARPLRVALAADRNEDDLPLLAWEEVAEALSGDGDGLTAEFAEFLKRDVLGSGNVSLDDAITTNRLYALSAAVLREMFGGRVLYQSSASPPLRGRYRYMGTTFSLDGGSMDYWVGLVNEGIPLSEHYHLMLASKHKPVRQPVEQPRATGDWKWAHWTGLGRVVRPLGSDGYGELLARLI